MPTSLTPSARTSARSVVLFVLISALLSILGLVVNLLVDNYFLNQNQQLIAEAHSRATENARTKSEIISRRLGTLLGLTQFLAQSDRAASILAEFGPDSQPSSQDRNVYAQRLLSAPHLAALNKHLQDSTKAFNVDVVFVLNASGDCIASSNAGMPDQFIGNNFQERHYFQQARTGSFGQQYAMGKVSKKAGLYYASPVMVNGKFIGAVVAKNNLDKFSYLIDQQSFIVDELGVVVLAKDHTLEMHALAQSPATRLPLDQLRSRYGREALPLLQLAPWGKQFDNLHRLNGEHSPAAIAKKNIENSPYLIYASTPLPGLQALESQAIWIKLESFLLSVLVILGALGLHAHIQSLKQNSRQLHESDLTYRGIFNSLNEAIYVQDTQGRFLDVNEGVLKMYNRPREFFIGKTPDIVSPPGRNDLAKLATQLKSAYEGEHQALEFWAVRANGEVFPKEVHLYPGEYFGQKVVLAIAQDITERKRTEEASQLAQLVYQNTSEGLVVCDANNTIIAINPAFTETTGYTEAEAIGQTPRLLHSGRQSTEFYEKMWWALQTDGHWQGEIWNRRKTGEIYPEWLTINTIYHPDGSVDRRVALFSDITKRKESDEIIWRQANFDSLTGLPNRRMFRDRLEQEIHKAIREGDMLALCFIDLDRFKEVNDTLGHEAGDQLLKLASERIRGCLRETDTVARLGGDEFTIILPHLRESSHIDKIALTLLNQLSAPFDLKGGHQAYVSASIGVTLFPDDGFEPEELIKQADQAMYAAKAQGRNCYRFFTPALQEAAVNRLQLATALRSALELREMFVVFQPIVRLSDGDIHKAEALLRWKHPVRGFISPADFIPLAEEIGLISELGNWVFREAMRCVNEWRDLHRGQLQVSVNMSPLQFHGADTAQYWFEHLASLGLTGNNVLIEITEGLLLHADPNITNKLLHYRDLGIQAAIDDFGTGYSSLAYLQKFDIDYLKIDQAFIRDIEQKSGNQALVEAIVVMAHKLGLKVIAEGVETEGQANLLKQVGCDYAQGYFFSRPLVPEAFHALMIKQTEHQA